YTLTDGILLALLAGYGLWRLANKLGNCGGKEKQPFVTADAKFVCQAPQTVPRQQRQQYPVRKCVAGSRQDTSGSETAKVHEHEPARNQCKLPCFGFSNSQQQGVESTQNGEGREGQQDNAWR